MIDRTGVGGSLCNCVNTRAAYGTCGKTSMASSAVFGEAAVEVAAVEEFMDDLRDDGAQGAAARLVVARVTFDESEDKGSGA